jgi:hypothetical protein
MDAAERVFGFQYKAMLTFWITVISKVYGIHFWNVPFELTFEAERPPPPHHIQQDLLMAAEESGEYF